MLFVKCLLLVGLSLVLDCFGSQSNTDESYCTPHHNFTFDYTGKQHSSFYYYADEFCRLFDNTTNAAILKLNITNAQFKNNSIYYSCAKFDTCKKVRKAEHYAQKTYGILKNYIKHTCEDHGGPEGQFLVLYAAFILFIGCVFKHFSEKYHLPVPYTVILLAAGAIIQVIYQKSRKEFGDLDEGFGALSKIDPHMILVLFVPGLIFESAFNTNYHIFIKEKEQALMLAFPGVIMNTLLTGGAMHYFNDYDWYWSFAWMFGSIVSATDPVAVVALLKELGASKRLSTLIEAESLLNDGTAFVLFVLLSDYASSLEAPISEFVVQCLQLAVGGLGLGILSGFLLYKGLSALYNDFEIEITLTLCGCYLAFYFGDITLKVSGVLTVVFMGLWTSKNRQAISPAVEESLHHFWEMVGFVANTILFFVTGQVVAFKVFQGNTEIRGQDYGFLLVLYIVCHISRGLTVWQMFPVLQNVGYGCTWQDATIMVYGGLRGAIGLALGLIVETKDFDEITEIEKVDKDRVLFHVCGIVTLTLIVNATTIKYVVAYLGLDKPSIDTIALFKIATTQLKEHTAKHLSNMKIDPHYGGANWIKVQELQPNYDSLIAKLFGKDSEERLENFNSPQTPKQNVTAKPGVVSSKLNTKTKENVGEAKQQEKNSIFLGFIDNLDKEENLQAEKQEIEKKVIQVMKKSYWTQFEQGLIGGDAVNILVEAAEVAIDEHDLSKQILLLDKYFRTPEYVLWLYKSPRKILKSIAESLLFSNLGFAVELASGFLYASQQAEKFAKVLQGKKELSESLIKPVIIQLKAVSTWIKKMSDNVESLYPEVHEAIQTQHAAHALLHHQKHEIKHLLHKGEIDETEYSKVVALPEGALNKLYHTSFSDFLTDSTDEVLLLQSPLFGELDEEQKSIVKNECTKNFEVFPRDSTVFSSFDKAKEIFVITRGTVAVKEVSSNIVRTLRKSTLPKNRKKSNIIAVKSRGEPFDVYTLLQETRYQHNFIVTSEFCYGYRVSSDLLAKLKDCALDFWDTLWRYSAIEIIKYYFFDHKVFQRIDLQGIEKIIFRSALGYFDGTDDQHAQIRVSKGFALLLNGSVVHITDPDTKVSAPTILRSSIDVYLARNDCVVIYLDVHKKRIKIPKKLAKFYGDGEVEVSEDTDISSSSHSSFSASEELNVQLSKPRSSIKTSMPKDSVALHRQQSRLMAHSHQLDLELYPESMPPDVKYDNWSIEESFEVVKYLVKKHNLFNDVEQFRVHATRLSSLIEEKDNNNNNNSNNNESKDNNDNEENIENNNNNNLNINNNSIRTSLRPTNRWARPSTMGIKSIKGLTKKLTKRNILQLPKEISGKLKIDDVDDTELFVTSDRYNTSDNSTNNNNNNNIIDDDDDMVVDINNGLQYGLDWKPTDRVLLPNNKIGNHIELANVNNNNNKEDSTDLVLTSEE